jgi:hypothetical protein
MLPNEEGHWYMYRECCSAIFLELITSLLFSIEYIRITYTSEYRITLLQYKVIYMYSKKEKENFPICSNDHVSSVPVAFNLPKSVV